MSRRSPRIARGLTPEFPDRGFSKPRCVCVFRRSAALAAAFAALAVLVATGAANGLDEWAVDHLMPGLGDASVVPTKLEAVVPLLHMDWHTTLSVVANLVTLPAQVLVASAIAAACWVVLWRRGRGDAALPWLVTWRRGERRRGALQVGARPTAAPRAAPAPIMRSSRPGRAGTRSARFSSPRSSRSSWPSATRWVVASPAASLVLLEIDGFHVPTDIAGGLLLALLAADLARRAISSSSR